MGFAQTVDMDDAAAYHAAVLQVIGQNVRTIRRASGMIQGELAARIGRSRASVLQLEKGVVDVRFLNLLDVADALGVSIHLLLQGLPQRSAAATDRMVRSLAQSVALPDLESVDDAERRARVLAALGENTRTFRMARGLSQAKLVERTGRRSRRFLADVELGTQQLQVTTLLDLADALEISLHVLIGDVQNAA